MKRNAPFYSLVRGIGVKDVYHDNDECTIAKSVEEFYRLPGKGKNRAHCAFCAILNEPAASKGVNISSPLFPHPEE